MLDQVMRFERIARTIRRAAFTARNKFTNRCNEIPADDKFSSRGNCSASASQKLHG